MTKDPNKPTSAYRAHNKTGWAAVYAAETVIEVDEDEVYTSVGDY